MTTAPILEACSRALAFFNRIPLRAPRPVPTTSAVGVAKQGGVPTMPRRSVIQTSVRVFPLLLAVTACGSPGPPGWTFTPLATRSVPGVESSPAATPSPPSAPSPQASPSPAHTPSPTPGSSGGDAGPVLATLEVRAFDIGYEPTTLTVDQPGRYLVRFVNTGELAHDIMFADGTMVDAAAGTTAEGELVVPTDGLSFACTRPGHAQVGQQGMLTVGR